MATINETLRDESIAHALWISRYSTGVASRMVKVLNESDAELSARLIVALETLDPASFTVQRIETMLVGVREINRQATAAYLNGMTTELRDFAEHEAGFQLSLFDALLPDEVKTHYPPHSVTPEMVYAAAMSRPFQGRLLKEWASGLEADRMVRISNTIRQGFLLGDTTTQLAKKIRGHANRGYQDGALQMSRSNAASIAKTAVGHVAATAREEFASVNDDLLSGKQWLSTLDNHTTPMCRIRGRLRYTLANKPIGHKIPYLQGPGKIHFCCRSTETLILKSAAELGLDIRAISGATRASMDGQVPADTDYSGWFARQPYERQKQIVGQQRARLMRDGGMSPDQFYTDRGDWLTLAQLRERDEQAFIRAGI